MIVNWNKKNAGLLTVSMIDTKNQNAILGTISLLPGHNDISNEQWEGIKDQLQDKIDQGTIVEVFEEKETSIEVAGKKRTKKKIVSSIQEFEAEKALDIVHDTYDLKTLKKWQKVEGRDEIRAAIAEQIKTVNNPNYDKDKDN